jgi:hypothetical protein
VKVTVGKQEVLTSDNVSLLGMRTHQLQQRVKALHE